MISRQSAGDGPRLQVEARPAEDATRVTVRGVADPSTHADLRAGLSGIDLAAGQAVHLHLADLRFCDAAAGHELVSFIEQARQHGRDVAIVGAQPGVRLMMTLLDAGGELAPNH